MALTEQDQQRIYGAAKALFSERKRLTLDDMMEYLRTVTNTPMEVADVEESFSRLFERRAGNLPAVELHQAFLFRDAAIGYWRAEYAIVVIQTSTIASDGKLWRVYAFYGLAGEEKGKLIGVTGGMGNVLKYLKDVGLDIPGWFPLAEWEHLLPGTPQERAEMIDRMGKEISIHRPVVSHP
jgi:hypothetical protein